MTELKVYKYEEWKEEGTRRFGKNPGHWKFKCPNCGHEQSMDDFVKANISEPENKVHFSCIGRWINGEGTIGNNKSPCNYTLGGLFKLATTSVIDQEGKTRYVFDFGKATIINEPELTKPH